MAYLSHCRRHLQALKQLLDIKTRSNDSVQERSQSFRCEMFYVFIVGFNLSRILPGSGIWSNGKANETKISAEEMITKYSN